MGKCAKCLLPREQWINEGSEVEIGESGEIKSAGSCTPPTKSESEEDEEDEEESAGESDCERCDS